LTIKTVADAISYHPCHFIIVMHIVNLEWFLDVFLYIGTP